MSSGSGIVFGRGVIFMAGGATTTTIALFILRISVRLLVGVGHLRIRIT
jgi:hypothetical protein